MANTESALRDYLDALLGSESESTSAAAAATDDTGTHWQQCALGRLHLLLPADTLDAGIDRDDLPAPPGDWHLASVCIGGNTRRVIELARIVAPALAAPAVDSLLPVTGSDWLLAVPGWPQPLTLSADAIQWRPRRNSRKWLAGMSCDARYMALDVHELIVQATGNADTAVEKPSS